MSRLCRCRQRICAIDRFEQIKYDDERIVHDDCVLEGLKEFIYDEIGVS